MNCKTANISTKEASYRLMTPSIMSWKPCMMYVTLGLHIFCSSLENFYFILPFSIFWLFQPSAVYSYETIRITSCQFWNYSEF